MILQRPEWLKSGKWGNRATIFFAVVSALAAMCSLYLFGAQRREEATAVLDEVEEQLISRDPTSSFGIEEAHAVKNKINRAYAKAKGSARVWALGGIYQTHLCYLGRNYVESGLEACQKAIGLDSDETAARYCLGLSHLTVSDYKAAQSDFQEVVNRRPDWDSAWYYYGIAAWGVGDKAAVERALITARDLRPKNLGYSLQIAAFYLDRKKKPEAIRLLQEVTAANPQSPEAANALGLALLQDHQAAAAEAEVRRAITLDPAESQYLINLSCLLDQQHRSSEALDLAQSVLALRPNSLDGLMGLMNAFVAKGDKKQALFYSAQLIKLANDFAWVRSNHEYLEKTSQDSSADGAYAFGPIRMLTSGNRWILTRFDPSVKDLIPVLYAEGKAVFPSEVAGSRPIGNPLMGVQLQPGEDKHLELCLFGCAEEEED